MNSLLQTVEISISGVNNDKQNDKKTRQTPIAHSSFLQNYIVGDRKDQVCDDDRLDSKNIDIRQFERNPHLETTIRARFNPKHVDERARIVQEMASEIFQTVRCRLQVRRWGRVGPDTRKSFGWVGHGKVGTIATIILLDILHEIIWFDRYVEKKGPTHRSERVCLGWDWFSDSVILIHVLHIWNLRGLRSADTLCVSQSEGNSIPFQ